MNTDDESFLSAYMDGQLAPDQQQLVESALVANPQLAERLRGFTLLRDMVAGLPRDRSVDVSSQVMLEIQARSRQRGLFRSLAGLRRGSRRILPLAGLAATAAGLMVAASLAILIQTSPIDRGGQQVAVLAGGETAVRSNPPSITPPTEAVANPGAPSVPSPSSHLEITGALAKGIVPVSTDLPARSSTPIAAASEPLPSADLERVRQLLDDPNLKRFFVVRNGSNKNSEQQVASIIEHTTRFDFFKITVSQGIVIDPRRPDEATVFAFALNANQVDRFREQLDDALPGLVDPEALDPNIATQLADIGRVGAFPPASLAEVEIPREALALRTNPREDLAPRAKVGGSTDRPHGDQIDPSRPAESVTAARPTMQADKRVVVLVWVSKPPAG